MMPSSMGIGMSQSIFIPSRISVFDCASRSWVMFDPHCFRLADGMCHPVGVPGHPSTLFPTAHAVGYVVTSLRDSLQPGIANATRVAQLSGQRFALRLHAERQEQKPDDESDSRQRHGNT